jgi:hypothetical protein
MISEIVPIVRTIDDHIDNWDAIADFVMKNTPTKTAKQSR